jgi:allantoinase
MRDQVFIGTIVLPDRVIERGYVLSSGGRVERVGAGDPPAGERHGGPDILVLPGAIDGQVHSRSPDAAEDFVWSTRSAASGGVTTIVDMPYDDGDLIATPERFARKVETAGAQARVDFALYATVDPAEGPARIGDLVAAGATAFKFSTFGTDPRRFPRIPPHVLHACFAALAPHGLVAGVHNENDEMVRAFMAAVRDSGVTDWRAHGRSRPPITETLAMAEIYEIGAATGCPAHVVHCSVGRGYELCAAYRAQGFASTVEACIHYLVLSEDDAARLGGRSKCNPPIRTREEVEALWRHLAAGNVSIVSTDHVSWPEERKTDPDMLANASGLPGLEPLVALLLKGLDERGLPLTWAARLLAHNPARLFRLGHRKGALEPGRDADMALVRREPWTYRAAASGNNFAAWSPYDGLALPFRVLQTFVRGVCLASEGQVLAEPGTGSFVSPLRPQGLAA